MEKVLVYGQNVKTLQTLREQLGSAKLRVITIQRQDSLPDSIVEHQPALIILDVEGREYEAPAICKHLRSDDDCADKPILLLSAPITAEHAAELLDAGADDLLRKPYREDLLLARVRALARFVHRREYDPPVPVRLWERESRVELGSRQVALTPVEFQLFSFLCHNQHRFYTAEELLQALWNYPPHTGDTALVRNHIRNLRRKLEGDPNYPRILVSRYGQGYRVRVVVQESH